MMSRSKIRIFQLKYLGYGLSTVLVMFGFILLTCLTLDKFGHPVSTLEMVQPLAELQLLAMDMAP